MKIVLSSSSLPSFLEEWINDKSDLCVYTPMQLAKFSRMHLVAGGWYLDCYRGFVPNVENPLTIALFPLPLRLLNWKQSRKKMKIRLLPQMTKRLH